MGYNWAKEKMKKLLLPITTIVFATIMLVLCTSFVSSNRSNNVETENLSCNYNVYANGQTDDGWYLNISYDCDCADPVVVKIAYYYKHGEKGSVREDEITCTLWNRRNCLIIGHANPYYDDNTTRYKLKSVQLK